jgi:ribose/xylose/arabinose/galactoside ABC-type transport system permease subunit
LLKLEWLKKEGFGRMIFAIGSSKRLSNFPGVALAKEFVE